jgi:hypothetical protein
LLDNYPIFFLARRKLNGMKCSWALVSAIFFWMPLTYAFLLVFPYNGPFLIGSVLITTCAISLAGTLLILSGKSRIPVKQYLVIPLALDLIIIFTLGIRLFLIEKGMILNGFSEPSWWTAWAAGILFLAPCSLLAFFGMPADWKGRSVSLALSAIICAPAALALVFVLMDYQHGNFESFFGPMALYWIVCMPVIGLCYIVTATYFKDE